jgi:Flp pilus assembly protein TadG
MHKLFGNSTRGARGQAAVEFTVMAIPAIIVLFVGIQFAVIARDSMALNQFAYQAARWTAAPDNSGSDCNALLSYIQANPSLMPAPVAKIVDANGISCASGGTAAPSGVVVTMACPGVTDCTQRAQGNQVQIVMAMSITSDLFLSTSFLGVSLPSSLSGESSLLTQGG